MFYLTNLFFKELETELYGDYSQDCLSFILLAFALGHIFGFIQTCSIQF